MSVLGLFVLRGLLVTLAVRQPFVVMNGPSSSRVAMNVDNTVSAAKLPSSSSSPASKSEHATDPTLACHSDSRPPCSRSLSTAGSELCQHNKQHCVASDARRGRREHEHKHEHEHDLDLDL